MSVNQGIVPSPDFRPAKSSAARPAAAACLRGAAGGRDCYARRRRRLRRANSPKPTAPIPSMQMLEGSGVA